MGIFSFQNIREQYRALPQYLSQVRSQPVVRTANAQTLPYPVPTPTQTPKPQVSGQSSQQPTYQSNQNMSSLNMTPYIPGITGSAPRDLSGGQTLPGGGNPAPNPYDQLQNNVSTGQGEDLNLIDQEYEQALSELAGQEQVLQSQAGVSEGKVRAEGQAYENTLTQNKAQSEDVVAGQETQARKEEAGGLRNARDIFRQIQQENIAKLSGLGISSSSVAEALAERLGVETARRIAGITGSTQEVLGNLNKERLRIQQVYTDKVAQVKEDVKNQIAEIQSKLMEGINTINAQRGRAALQKSQARTGIIQEARQQITQLQIQAAEYEQKLRDAATRRSEAIKNTIPLFNVGETGLTQLNPTITAQYQALSQLSPNLNVGINSGMSQGVPTLQGYTFSQKKENTEDDLESLI